MPRVGPTTSQVSATRHGPAKSSRRNFPRDPQTTLPEVVTVTTIRCSAPTPRSSSTVSRPPEQHRNLSCPPSPRRFRGVQVLRNVHQPHQEGVFPGQPASRAAVCGLLGATRCGQSTPGTDYGSDKVGDYARSTRGCGGSCRDSAYQASQVANHASGYALVVALRRCFWKSGMNNGSARS